MKLRNIAVAAVVVQALTAGGVAGQGSSGLEIETGIRASIPPIYFGDATVGPVTNWGIGASVGVQTERAPGWNLEGFYTFSPRDDDLYDRGPQIELLGLVIRHLWRDQVSVQPFVGGGAGMIQVAYDESPCPPPYCFREGGVRYEDGSLRTWILEAGLLIREQERIQVRTDVRLHNPSDAPEMADTNNLLPEFGLTVLLRW